MRDPGFRPLVGGSVRLPRTQNPPRDLRACALLAPRALVVGERTLCPIGRLFDSAVKVQGCRDECEREIDDELRILGPRYGGRVPSTLIGCCTRSSGIMARMARYWWVNHAQTYDQEVDWVWRRRSNLGLPAPRFQRRDEYGAGCRIRTGKKSLFEGERSVSVVSPQERTCGWPLAMRRFIVLTPRLSGWFATRLSVS